MVCWGICWVYHKQHHLLEHRILTITSDDRNDQYFEADSSSKEHLQELSLLAKCTFLELHFSVEQSQIIDFHQLQILKMQILQLQILPTCKIFPYYPFTLGQYYCHSLLAH